MNSRVDDGTEFVRENAWYTQPEISSRTDCHTVHAKRTAVLISTHEHKNEVTALPLAKLIEKR